MNIEFCPLPAGTYVDTLVEEDIGLIMYALLEGVSLHGMASE